MTQFVTDDLPGPLGAVVHIGAGRGTAVSAYRAAGATRIVLVEPDPEAAAQLRSRLASAQNVSLVTAAIVGDTEAGGTTLLNRFSFAELNALRAPTGLLEIFPGLETLAPAEVATLTPSALIAAHLPILPATGPEVDVDEADRPIDVLVLEAPGEALAILATLEQDGHLARFGRIVVQEGRKQLYEGAAPIDRVVTFLKTAGFAAPLYDRADPDRPTLRTDRDLEADTLARLIRERDDLLGQQKALKDSLKATSDQQDQDLHGRASQIIVLESALREQSAESTRLLNVLAETEMRLDLCRKGVSTSQDHPDEKVAAPKPSKLESLLDTNISSFPQDVMERQFRETIDKAHANPETLFETIEAAVENLSKVERTWFFLALADAFTKANNSLMAIDSLSEAETTLPSGLSELRLRLCRAYLERKANWPALQTLVTGVVDTADHFTPSQISALRNALRKGENIEGEHGHVLLLEALKEHPPKSAPDERKRVLVEVGSTRERVPGQGSTLKIARQCRAMGLHMVTVDMDPRNTALAAKDFTTHKLPFEAINSKGEDYLRDHSGPFDYVFLDAYDFDHGKHSELRQSRYEAFLGSRIDEKACHKMHLDCAKALVSKLSNDGLICIDDTWLDENDNWTAKGKLAVPFLLESGFELVDVRNRAVLLRRSKQGGEIEADEPKAATTLSGPSHETVKFPDFSLRIEREDRSAAAYKSRDWFEEVTSPLYRHIRKTLNPTICLDIGANYGAISLAVKTAMPEVEVISVEPNLALHPYLTHNLADWSDKGWRLEKAIVAAASRKQAHFHVNPKSTQDSRVVAAGEDWSAVDTRAVTLTSLLSGHGDDPRAYIKIDTQGYEPKIFKGGRKYLEGTRNWLIRMEYAPDWIRSQGEDPSRFLRWLTSTFHVIEFPKRYRFTDRLPDLLMQGKIAPERTKDFVRYCVSLNRADLGWVDLMVCPKESPLLSGPPRKNEKMKGLSS